MADVAFPWLYDFDRRVRQKVNQPRDKPGQPTWDDEEFEQAYNKAYKDLYREISNFDVSYQTTFVDVVIAVGATEYALPARAANLRLAMVMKNGRAWWPIRRGQADYVGQYLPGQMAELRPDRNSITFTVPTTEPLNVRLHYGSYYTPLIHSYARTSGGSNVQLAAWQTIETDAFTGLSIKVAEGTGVGQERTATTYLASTKTLAISAAWTTQPDDTSLLTSKPDLPLWAEDAFENTVVAVLYEKTNEQDQIQKFMGLANAKLDKMRTAIKTQERREPSTTFDQNLNGGWGDPGDLYRL